MEYKLIAFDADDTLWDCQSHFADVEKKYACLLQEYGIDAETTQKNLFATECGNMPLFGYGVKAFMLSMIENANSLTNGKIGGQGIEKILMIGRQLLTFDPTPLDGVEEVLADLSERKELKLAVFTKGELLDQNSKLDRSGLRHYFDLVDVVNDKTPDAVRILCHMADVKPSDLLMVGNSFKSDVIPAISVGASAVYVPAKKMWKYEQTEEYEHQHITKIDNLRELLNMKL